MPAALRQPAGVATVEDVPDPTVVEPIDVLVRVFGSCIGGSDLWSCRGMLDRGYAATDERRSITTMSAG